MGKTYEGNLDGKGKRFCLVVSRFNDFITKELLAGAKDGLCRHGVQEEDISVAWVPGSYEAPLVAKNIAARDDVDGVICLGAVIRGSTPHFDYVAAESAKGIAAASMETNTPVIYGIITTDSIEQAIERAGTKMGNKGFHASQTAIEMVNLMEQVKN